MASARTTPSKGERRLSLRTLGIASVASATAAIIVSTFWRSGTPIAAAITPVVVALVSEMLHRPADAIAERVTVNRPALQHNAPLPPEARLTRASQEAARERVPADRGPREPLPPRERLPEENGNGDYRVYSTRADAPVAATGGGGRRLPWKVIAVTAALAFAIGATVLTVPELLAGKSFGSGGGHTTIFSGGKTKKKSTTDENTTTDQRDNQDQQSTTTTPDQQQDQDQDQQQQQTTPQKAPTKTTPQNVAPQSRSGQGTKTGPTTTSPPSTQP